MKIQAIPFKQEGKQMYISIVSAVDLIANGKVDEWKEVDGKETGYQRKPERGRASKIANYLKKDSQPLMPTSILLGYRGSLDVEPSTNGAVLINFPVDEKIWIVDGQHRIAGLEKAITEDGVTRLIEYNLPVVIVEFDSQEDEANQFRIINETMKKVRTDLARRLLASRMVALGRAGKLQLREEGRLWEAVAVEIIKSLNNDEDSPWFNRIQKPGEKKQPDHAIRELSLSTSLKPIITRLPYRSWPGDRLASIIKEYWKAWADLVPEAFGNANEYVIMKTPGAFSLHTVAWHVMEVLRLKDKANPLKEDFINILKDLDEMAIESYWASDNVEGAALAGSMKGFGILADAMIEILTEKGHST